MPLLKKVDGYIDLNILSHTNPSSHLITTTTNHTCDNIYIYISKARAPPLSHSSTHSFHFRLSVIYLLSSIQQRLSLSLEKVGSKHSINDKTHYHRFISYIYTINHLSLFPTILINYFTLL